MARKTATAKVEVRVQELKMRTIQLPIRGFDGPLVVNNWSAKAVREMLEKQITTKKRTKGPDPKDPEQDFRNSLYTYQQNGKTCYGFPATAFKKAMVRAVKLLKDTKQLDLDMVMAKQILFVIPDAQEDREGGEARKGACRHPARDHSLGCLGPGVGFRSVVATASR